MTQDTTLSPPRVCDLLQELRAAKDEKAWLDVMDARFWAFWPGLSPKLKADVNALLLNAEKSPLGAPGVTPKRGMNQEELVGRLNDLSKPGGPLHGIRLPPTPQPTVTLLPCTLRIGAHDITLPGDVTEATIDVEPDGALGVEFKRQPVPVSLLLGKTETFDWVPLRNEPLADAKPQPDHALKMVTVANGAGRGVCSCGWQSRVADDGRPGYTSADIKRDFEQHAKPASPVDNPHIAALFNEGHRARLDGKPCCAPIELRMADAMEWTRGYVVADKSAAAQQLSEMAQQGAAANPRFTVQDAERNFDDGRRCRDSGMTLEQVKRTDTDGFAWWQRGWMARHWEIRAADLAGEQLANANPNFALFIDYAVAAHAFINGDLDELDIANARRNLTRIEAQLIEAGYEFPEPGAVQAAE